MTKQEYMDKLAKALEEKIPEMKDEVLEDYEAHFTMAMADGKTEEQICDALGSIDDFVDELANMTEREKKETKNGSSSNFFSNAFAGVNFEELISSVTEGVKEAGETITKGMNGFAETLKNVYHSDDVQGAIKSGKNFVNHEMNFFKEKFEAEPIDAEYVDAEEASSTYVNTSSNKKIVIDALIADVDISKSDDDSVHISYENNGKLEQQIKYRYFFKEEDNTIYAGVKKCLTKDGLFGEATNPSIELTIELPESMESVIVNSVGGDIEVEGVQIKNMKLQSSSGDINVSNVQAEALMAYSVSGDVDMQDVTTDDFATQTTSGDISYNGNMKKSAFKTISGDVEVDTEQTFEGNFVSVSGDIDVQAECDFEGSFSTTSGDVQIELDNKGNGYSLSFQTASGDVKIEYDDQSHSFSKNGKYEYGNKGTVIYAKTFSGDINLSQM